MQFWVDKVIPLTLRLANDCLGLLEVMSSFNQTVYDMTYVNEKYYSKKKNDFVNNEGGLNMTNFLTGATLASL